MLRRQLCVIVFCVCLYVHLVRKVGGYWVLGGIPYPIFRMLAVIKNRQLNFRCWRKVLDNSAVRGIWYVCIHIFGYTYIQIYVYIYACINPKFDPWYHMYLLPLGPVSLGPNNTDHRTKMFGSTMSGPGSFEHCLGALPTNLASHTSRQNSEGKAQIPTILFIIKHSLSDHSPLSTCQPQSCLPLLITQFCLLLLPQP